MFDWIHSHRRLIQVMLALVTVPFAFWGISFYERAFTGGAFVAAVDGQKIGVQEFTDSLRQQQDRLRTLLGRNYDASLFDSPAARLQLLEGLISQRLMLQYALGHRMTIPDAELRDTIAAIPAFQENGRFSMARYEAMLRAEGYGSPLAFEASLRQDLVMRQLTGAIADSSFASREVARRLAELHAEQREVAALDFAADPFVAQMKITPEQIKAYYDANPTQFQVPEQLKVQYVVLNADALAAQEKIGADEIKAYYDANPAKFGEPEQRRASHILIAVKNGASEADWAAARVKAEKILAEARKAPQSFAELARKYSEDSGSAARGGDLGWFSRGAIVKPFEDAVFGLRPGEIAGPVKSDFGYHIIMLTGVRPGKMKTLEQARPEIEKELAKQRAAKRFAEAAESFSNIVYEQPDSLKPAADRFGLAVQQADGVTRQSAPVPVLNNAKMLAALFSDDVLRAHHNTEAIETAPGTLVAARVLEHRPASRKPLEEVRDAIARELQRRQALALVRGRGAERLAQLRKGDAAAAAGFGAPKLVSREDPKGLDARAIEAIFGADASKLPAYVGLDTPGGYAIYRISRVVSAPPDEARERAMQSELGRADGAEELNAFIAALRAGAKIEINKELIEKNSP